VPVLVFRMYIDFILGTEPVGKSIPQWQIMALHLDFGRAGIEIIGFTRHQSGKKVDSDHKSVKHGLGHCSIHLGK